MSKVKYRVKLAEYPAGQAVPTEDLDIFLNIGNVKPVKGEDGKMVYYSKSFSSKDEAESTINSYKTYGLEDMSTVVEYQGEYFTPEEFEEKLKP